MATTVGPGSLFPALPGQWHGPFSGCGIDWAPPADATVRWAARPRTTSTGAHSERRRRDSAGAHSEPGVNGRWLVGEDRKCLLRPTATSCPGLLNGLSLVPEARGRW